jgi:hypothetical protein
LALRKLYDLHGSPNCKKVRVLARQERIIEARAHTQRDATPGALVLAAQVIIDRESGH